MTTKELNKYKRECLNLIQQGWSFRFNVLVKQMSEEELEMVGPRPAACAALLDVADQIRPFSPDGKRIAQNLRKF